MANTTHEKIVEKIDEAIEALLTGGAVQSYTIAGRSITKYSLSELVALRDKFQDMIDAEDSGGGVTYADLRSCE